MALIKQWSDNIYMSVYELKAEIVQWKKDGKTKKMFPLPVWKLFPFAIAFCQQSTLLTIFNILPITTATSERIFSTLKRLKTYLRSTMLQEHLNMA